MKAFILSTGDELVRGRTLDRNTVTIARGLSEHGVTVVGAEIVGDDAAALIAAIERAATRADVVVMSGGLGPTADDCTRAAAAAAAGCGLERREDLVSAIRARWTRRGRQMPESNLVQADVPAGAEGLANDHGTAPGFRVRVRGAELFALPGPPHELGPMLERHVLPFVRMASGETGRVVRTVTVETFGERESAVGERLADLMGRGASPRVGTTAARGTIRAVVHAEGPAADVERRLSETVAEIERRLGPIVFGRDGVTLAEVLVDALRRTRTTLATAESCTGGMVAAALTDRPGASEVFPGGVVTYSNAEKTRLLGVAPALLAEHGAVSEPVVRAMAEGARAAFGTDLAVALSGIAGPGGGSAEKPVGLVHLALASERRTTHRRVVLPGGRELVREIATKCALDLVRRALPAD